MNKLLLDRLSAIMADRKITQAELAQRSGIRASSISDYLKGKYAPKQDKIALIAKALSVDPAWLMGYDNTNSGKEAPGFDPSTLPNYIPITKKKIPLLGKIAAGQPITALENIEEYLPIDDDIKADFALRVQGDSMINAGIEDTDIVFIREQPDVEDGQIAAVLIDDEATLKRVYKMPGFLQLNSENPRYKPMIFNETNCTTCRILGLAVAVLSKI